MIKKHKLKFKINQKYIKMNKIKIIIKTISKIKINN